MTGAQQVAEALQRLSTGDQDPPRPWAYLAGLGVTRVSDTAGLTIRGFTDMWGFDMTVDGKQFRVMIWALDDPSEVPPRLCEERIYHGPGHQSSTGCRVRGPHDVHEAVYGEFNRLARWRGKPDGRETFTGAFDEPPYEEDDDA